LEVHTDGARKSRDIDLVLKDGDLDIFADRIGCNAKNRQIDKGTFFVEDYGFETMFLGQEIEATKGYPVKRVQEETFNKLFSRRVKRDYQGVEVYLAPIEEILVSKAYMSREKDLADLRLLKEEKLEVSFLHELAKDWGETEKIIRVLRKEGYKI